MTIYIVFKRVWTYDRCIDTYHSAFSTRERAMRMWGTLHSAYPDENYFVQVETLDNFMV